MRAQPASVSLKRFIMAALPVGQRQFQTHIYYFSFSKKSRPAFFSQWAGSFRTPISVRSSQRQ
ncbi:MAG TPA: hypothetical protein DDW50_00410 [Firmicutes bacterium]|nr:hypothetical protein [Bacillota bacterium]